MATAHQIHLSPTRNTRIFSVSVPAGPSEASARATSEVLQHDLEHHHVFFNDSGFHNHIVHHILSIHALGASAEEIRAAYERDRTYQRKAMAVDEAVVAELADRNRFLELLGMRKHYSNFLRFFQGEIERVGVEEVLRGFLFREDEVARAMLGRVFGGLVHPFIHLGFGLEFEQPAIVAEALAQTAIHEDWTGPMFFWPAEEQAGGVGRRGEKGLLAILEAIRRDETLARSVQWEDGNKMRDGVLARAGEAMLTYAAQYTVSAEQLEERTAEMINTVVYYTSAAQRPSKQIKFDFFYLHSLNSSIFFSKLLTLPFLDTTTKCRLLEWKGRLDLLLYVSRGTPELYLDEIRAYPTAHSWAEIFAFCNRHSQDDGHLAKLVRAVANGERACRPFEEERRWPIKGDMWLRIANMAMDSTSDHDHHPMWVRSTGFDQAWREFDGRAEL
ncbi:hypothetical protein ASPACDRAFT_55148 [Aspergillus aculeatus ATCC 16872]|uniref:HypA-like protein n=1 Tax=Aspergillus aculeatus (strain ATCC 16872 / CBS 172.66 / WB 5094) TaxID=690307 RepID=A0A1L9WH00_ASPA1|nr:uncharacterized protein ASPACDRAFT_55148 [Aspergillus aculeatus ATCC 16872]OJJ95464.1 hypothetical protein ASPACDRAFT_55148 [Aspergillus aculeatus ATCC 16872]